MTDSVGPPLATDDRHAEEALAAAHGEAEADVRHAEEASAAAQDEEEELATSDGGSDAGKRNPDVDVLAKGIASVLGPVMSNFDGGVEGALKSQSVLASSIDRLTRELDKLLEDVPHPYATHHATRLSGIRKRVLSLNSTLRIIQKRMDMIQRLLAGYASRTATRANQEKASLSLTEGSRSMSGDASLREIPFSEVSCHSADPYRNYQEQVKMEDQEMSEFPKNLPPGALQEDSLQEKEAPRIDREMAEFPKNLPPGTLQEDSLQEKEAPRIDFGALNREAVIDQERGGRSIFLVETQDEHAQAVIDQEPGGRSVAIEGAQDVDVQGN